MTRPLAKPGGPPKLPPPGIGPIVEPSRVLSFLERNDIDLWAADANGNAFDPKDAGARLAIVAN